MRFPEFPFKARINGHIVTVTGRHECGLYRVTGFGLVQGPLQRIEDPQEVAPVFAQQAAIEQNREWVRRGFFKDKPMRPGQRQDRANATRNWLFTLLYRAGPVPAKEVYRQAAEWGIPARGVRRAKRHQRIKSVKRGGRQHGYGSTWYWELPELKLQ
jgi:hypothetical protein